MLQELREAYNREFTPERYRQLGALLQDRSGCAVQFRVAETPVFVEGSLLEEMAAEGGLLAHDLLAAPEYLAAARRAIPEGYRVANESAHPHFLTADFALVRDDGGQLTPRLVEIQAFPSVFAFQALLCSAYREVFELPAGLGTFLGGLDEASLLEALCENGARGPRP